MPKILLLNNQNLIIQFSLVQWIRTATHRRYTTIEFKKVCEIIL